MNQIEHAESLRRVLEKLSAHDEILESTGAYKIATANEVCVVAVFDDKLIVHPAIASLANLEGAVTRDGGTELMFPTNGEQMQWLNAVALALAEAATPVFTPQSGNWLSGHGPNVEIAYMYRDGDNFKQSETIVIKGPVGPGELRLLSHVLDEAQYFIPGQIGLPDLQERFNGGQAQWNDERDHVWHELGNVSFTDLKATCEVPWDTVRSHLLQVLLARNNGWDTNYRPAAYLQMVARHREANLSQ